MVAAKSASNTSSRSSGGLARQMVRKRGWGSAERRGMARLGATTERSEPKGKQQQQQLMAQGQRAGKRKGRKRKDSIK